MLYLIGMGLEEGDMTQKGVNALKKCKHVFTDTYTSVPYRIFGKEAGRELVEGDYLIELAEKEDVALVVSGDPLFATTHLALFSDAVEAGISVRVIHAPSILNAISRTGLSSYKFGRIITVGETLMKSDEDRVNSNLRSNLHTLCLFDPSVDPEVCIRAVLEKFSQKLIVCSRLGTAGERIWYGVPDDRVEKPACAIIPAELAFYEKEFLSRFST